MNILNRTLKAGVMAVLVTCFSLSASTSSFAQTGEIKHLAGYVDFADLTDVYGEPMTEINLGPSMLGFAGSIIGADDPESQAMLRELKSVRLKIYDISGSAEVALAQIQKTSKQLIAKDWEQIVKVKEDGEEVRVFLKMVNSQIEGMTVLVAGDEDQAIFINIIGSIKPADLGKLTEAFDVDIDLP